MALPHHAGHEAECARFVGVAVAQLRGASGSVTSRIAHCNAQLPVHRAAINGLAQCTGIEFVAASFY